MIRGNFLMTKVSKAQAARETSFGFLIQTLARRIDSRMKSELKKVGIDIKLFANLMVLAGGDGINQRRLGEKLNFPDYFTSRNVDALVEAGFAERRPDPDSRRSFLIFLTDAGRAKAALLPPIIKRVNDEFLAGFSVAERKQVIGLLKQAAGSAPSSES